jgi:uncharacterized protein YaiE (UPF0345 family)
MDTTGCYRIGLAARGLFVIEDARDVEMSCARGCLWITLDGEEHDVVLEPGQRFRTRMKRRAIVYAFEPSSLQVRHPQARAPALQLHTAV